MRYRIKQALFALVLNHDSGRDRRNAIDLNTLEIRRSSCIEDKKVAIKWQREERRKKRHEPGQSILFHYDYPRQLLRIMVKVRHLNVISCRRQGAYLGGTATLYTWYSYNLILFPGCYKRVYFMASFLRSGETRHQLLAIVLTRYFVSPCQPPPFFLLCFDSRDN